MAQQGEPNLDQIWDEIVFLEANSVRQGHEEGQGRGRKKDLSSGWNLGIERGQEIASEVGFYQGFAKAWLRIPGALGVTERERKRSQVVLEKLEQLCQQFPNGNNSDCVIFFLNYKMLNH